MAKKIGRRELFRKGPLALLGIAAAPLLPREESPVKVTNEKGQPIIRVEGDHVVVERCNVAGGIVTGDMATISSSMFDVHGAEAAVKVEGGGKGNVFVNNYVPSYVPSE